MPWLTIGPYNSYETFVDDEDVELCKSRHWFFDRYVRARKGGATLPDGTREPSKSWVLHREIMKPEADMSVDHIDGNPLNNSRSNLRCCTQADNNKNVNGYCIHDRSKDRPNSPLPFQAVLTHNYKRVYLGRFATEEEALIAVNAKKLELRGEFARLQSNKLMESSDEEA